MLQEDQLSFLTSEVAESSDAVPIYWHRGMDRENIYRSMSMTDASQLRHALHGQNLWKP